MYILILHGDAWNPGTLGGLGGPVGTQGAPGGTQGPWALKLMFFCAGPMGAQREPGTQGGPLGSLGPCTFLRVGATKARLGPLEPRGSPGPNGPMGPRNPRRAQGTNWVWGTPGLLKQLVPTMRTLGPGNPGTLGGPGGPEATQGAPGGSRTQGRPRGPGTFFFDPKGPRVSGGTLGAPLGPRDPGPKEAQKAWQPESSENKDQKKKVPHVLRNVFFHSIWAQLGVFFF